MKATEFCKFFDFNIDIVPIDEVSEDDRNDFALQEEWVYEMTDDQGTFRTRYADSICTIADLFDSMLLDYVDSTLSDFGFEWDQYSMEPQYEQALKWIKGTELEGTNIHRVIECMVDPSKIKDDLKEMVM